MNKINENKLNSKNVIKNSIIIGISSLFLVGVLVYVNFFDNSVPNDNIQYGNQVGDNCVNQEIQLINNEEGNFEINHQIGKVTVINFWGTWCTPCIEELPEFDELYKQYSDKVYVIAIHQAGFKEEKVNEFIQNRWPEFTIHLGLDNKDDPYFTKMGGLDVWPITTIVDKEGIIAFTHQGKISGELLTQEVTSLF